MSCHFHVKHVGQAGCIIIPDCKGLTQAFMQFVLGDNRDFGVLSVLIYPYGSHLPVTCLPGGAARPLG